MVAAWVVIHLIAVSSCFDALSIQARVIHLLVPSGVPAVKVISDPEVCTVCIPKIFALLSQ